MKKVVTLLAAMLSGCILVTGLLRPECGDGVLEPGEECEDGNTTPQDGCDSECLAEPIVCGDSILIEPELCDDGNVIDGDGCSASCLSLEICGDGFVDAIEGCDDGNLTSGDGCDASCVIEFCGDGIINNLDEVCEDANVVDGDGCDNNCQTSCDNLALTFGAASAINDPSSGHCYLLSSQADTWDNAVADCAALSANTDFPGHVVTITSVTENTLVRSLDPGSLWMGLTDQLNNTFGTDENRFRWITKERLSPFMNFAAGQPNNSGGQDCVAFVANATTWDDFACTNTKQYVCELDFSRACGNGVVEQGELCDDGNNTANDGCSADCSTFDCNQEGGLLRRTMNLSDACFVLFSNSLSITAAQADCATRGGHLASITTAEENNELDLLGDILGGFLAIGLTDIAVENSFTWSNGEEFGFNGFGVTQPDDFQGAEDCVELRNTDDWNDINCTAIRAHICEF